MYTDPTGYFSLSEAMGSTVVRSVVSNTARGASRAFVDTLIDTAIDLMLGEELSAKNFWRNYFLNFAFSFGRGPGNPYKPGNLADNFNQQNLRHANKGTASAGKGNKVKDKTHQTYTKRNPTTGEVYSGRTSGTGSPYDNVAKRDTNHHMNKKGFEPAKLDKSSTNKDAIRGREQQLIDHHGGAKSKGGTSGNEINGISDVNPNREKYLNAANREW